MRKGSRSVDKELPKKAHATKASPKLYHRKRSKEKRKKSRSPWGKSQGAWSKEQPRTIGEKRQQIDICQKEGRTADFCFLGGITRGQDGRVIEGRYPRCAVGTCKISKRGESAAQGYARRICKSPKYSAKSKSVAKQVLSKLGKACR